MRAGTVFLFLLQVQVVVALCGAGGHGPARRQKRIKRRGPRQDQGEYARVDHNQ